MLRRKCFRTIHGTNAQHMARDIFSRMLPFGYNKQHSRLLVAHDIDSALRMPESDVHPVDVVDRKGPCGLVRQFLHFTERVAMSMAISLQLQRAVHRDCGAEPGRRMYDAFASQKIHPRFIVNRSQIHSLCASQDLVNRARLVYQNALSLERRLRHCNLRRGGASSSSVCDRTKMQHILVQERHVYERKVSAC